MFKIKTDGFPKGYGYVVDFLGNIWFYGPVEECAKFIKCVMGCEVGV